MVRSSQKVAAIVDHAEDLIVELLDRERHVEGRTIARDRNRFDRVLAVLDRETRHVQERRHQPARGSAESKRFHAEHDLEDGERPGSRGGATSRTIIGKG